MVRPLRTSPRNMPGFQQVVLTVTEQDVGLPEIGEKGVRAALAAVPFERAFVRTARIDAFIRHSREHDHVREAQIEAATEVFAGHPKHRELVDLVRNEDRELFNTPHIHAIQRLLVQEARDDRGRADLALMQAAFLGISNVVAPSADRPQHFDRDYHLAMMLRGLVANSTEPMLESITRAYAIYHELPRRADASQVPNYMPRERWEPDPATELSIRERFTTGMAVMSMIGVFDDQLPLTPASVPGDRFTKLAGGDVDRIQGAIAADRAWFRERFAQEPPQLRNTAANSIPFQVRPLLRLSTGDFVLSSTDALASWMTRGVHYACLSRLRDPAESSAFLSYVGHLFEAYALELMQDVHRAHPDVRVMGEQLYDGGSSRTSDIAVADGNDLVLIEVEARRFSREALLSRDPRDALREIEIMVVKKARQLDRCIEALRRGQAPARLPGVDVASIERIWPVLVLEGAIAQTPVLRDHLATELGRALRQPGVERLSILSISDFEILCGLIEHQHHLPMTLKRWQHSSSHRDSDFNHFILTRPDLRPRRASLVERRWERLTDEVNSALSA